MYMIVYIANVIIYTWLLQSILLKSKVTYWKDFDITRAFELLEKIIRIIPAISPMFTFYLILKMYRLKNSM